MEVRRAIRSLIESGLVLVISIVFCVLYIELGFITVFLSNHNIGPVLYFFINVIIGFTIYKKSNSKSLAILYILVNTLFSFVLYGMYIAMMGI